MPQPLLAEEPDFAAFIAIDWSDRQHVWVLQVAGGTQREMRRLEHTPEGIEAWAVQCATRFSGRPVAVALEQAHGSLIYALSQYSHLVLYPIHPTTSHNYRKAVYPCGSKDDGRDAHALLDLLTAHRDRLRRIDPDTEQTRHLQALVQKRRQLVDQRTAQTNRITDQLKLYFPQVLQWFDDLASPMLAAFLQRWPTLPQLQAEHPEQVRTFLYQHGSRSAARIQQRLEEIPVAKPLMTDAAVIEPGVLVVRTLLAVVAALSAGIRELEQAIHQIATSHPDYFIFSSFPASGAVMAPRLVAAFGSQRERYTHANQMQSFSGIAPVRQASGQQCTILFRWACPKFLRQTFHEYAGLSIQHCAWARAFYDQQKQHKKSHHAAVRALAFKWIRIMFRCWQSRQPYQESLFLAARQGRAIPLARRPGHTPRQRSSPCRAKQAFTAPTEETVDFGLRKAGDILKSLMEEA